MQFWFELGFECWSMAKYISKRNAFAPSVAFIQRFRYFFNNSGWSHLSMHLRNWNWNWNCLKPSVNACSTHRRIVHIFVDHFQFICSSRNTHKIQAKLPIFKSPAVSNASVFVYITNYNNNLQTCIELKRWWATVVNLLKWRWYENINLETTLDFNSNS